ncbi:MAG TPA: HAD family phosphatase [Solirubrobacteraceae bacterium]|jgi:HAD superfamily hydrolase (TIGR01509 family)
MEAHAHGRRCDAVVFDNDGLLLDTEQSWTRAEAALFERRGMQFTMDHKRDLLGSAPGIAAAKLERMLDEPGRGGALIMELGMLVMSELATYAAPRPGALELIARLREAGVPMALATNAPRMLVDAALATGGIDPATFTVLLSADDVVEPKPAPEIYLAAATGLGTAPARTLVLEDSPTGVAAAVAAGCVAFAIPSLDGVDLSEAELVLDSLAAPQITQALGL